MKKVLVMSIVALAVAFGGLGAAQQYGFYAGYGYDGMLGGQFYLNDNLRMSVGITPVIGLAVQGSMDFVLGEAPLSKGTNELRGYYGIGFGGGFVTVLSVGVFDVHGHGFGGIKFGIPNSDVSVFGEAGIGPMMLFGSGGSVFTFAYDFKMGVLFK